MGNSRNRKPLNLVYPKISTRILTELEEFVECWIVVLMNGIESTNHRPSIRAHIPDEVSTRDVIRHSLERLVQLGYVTTTPDVDWDEYRVNPETGIWNWFGVEDQPVAEMTLAGFAFYRD